MKPRSHGKPSSPALRARRLKWVWIAAGALVVAGLTAVQTWRMTAPPAPLVATTGFDPAIAKAIEQARQSIRRSPRSAEARGHLGMVLLAHELRAPARDCFAQAMSFAPQEPRWPYFLGLTQLPDSPAAAVTNLQRAVQLFPQREIAPRLKLADALFELGRLDEAADQFQRVSKIDPSSAPANLGLGKIASARDQLTNALRNFNAATSNPSTRKAAQRLLVGIHQRLGHTNEATQIAAALAAIPNDDPLPDPFFAEVQQLKTGETAWIDQSDEWIKAGRAADAAKLLEKTVALYTNSDRAMFFLGRARLRLGDVAGAEQILTRAAAVAPDSVEIQMQLGVTRLSRGHGRQAQECFRAALRTKPNFGEAWFNLGLSLAADPNHSACIAAFREAIRLKPNLIEAYLGLAVALRADGQPQAAADELRRALNLQPEESMRRKLMEQLKLVE